MCSGLLGESNVMLPRKPFCRCWFIPTVWPNMEDNPVCNLKKIMRVSIFRSSKKNKIWFPIKNCNYFTIILCALCIFWFLSSGLVPWAMRQGIISYITNKQGVLPFSLWVRILGTISPKCEAWGIWIFPKTVQVNSTIIIYNCQWLWPICYILSMDITRNLESIWMNDFRWFGVKGRVHYC